MQFLQVMTIFLRTKLEVGGDIKVSIQNGKFFELECLEPVGPTPAATNAMLQVEYSTRAKRVHKLRINLRMTYGIVLRQCT